MPLPRFTLCVAWVGRKDPRVQQLPVLARTFSQTQSLQRSLQAIACTSCITGKKRPRLYSHLIPCPKLLRIHALQKRQISKSFRSYISRATSLSSVHSLPPLGVGYVVVRTCSRTFLPRCYLENTQSTTNNSTTFCPLTIDVTQNTQVGHESNHGTLKQKESFKQNPVLGHRR